MIITYLIQPTWILYIFILIWNISISIVIPNYVSGVISFAPAAKAALVVATSACE